MALGVDQLLGFLDCYYRHFPVEEGVGLLQPKYHEESHSVTLIMQRPMAMKHLPGMTVERVVRRLPVKKMEGGAEAIIEYVSGQLSEMKEELLGEESKK